MTLEMHFSVTLDSGLMAGSWLGLAKLLHFHVPQFPHLS